MAIDYNSLTPKGVGLIGALFFWICLIFYGAEVQAAGLLTPSDGSLPALDIKTHQVNVIIENGYAITTIEQQFHNPHGQDLEAIYSFPVPQKGAVSEFTVWIDGQPVTGEVLEKKTVRQIYQEEKALGNDAGLVEQDAYRTFSISVSPVRSKQDTKVRLVYMQPVPVDTGIGRYVYPLEEGGVDEQQLAFWTGNDVVTEQFSFTLNLKSGYPLAAVRMPNHPNIQPTQLTDGSWQIHLSNQAQTQEHGTGSVAQPAFTLNQDLIVYWRLQEGLPGAIDLVTYKPDAKQRGTFMLTVTPGDDLKPIREGSDWLFVLDISGSMSRKYATLAEGVNQALGKMRPNDRFRIFVFNDHAREITSGYVNATPDQVRHYSQAVTELKPTQGTNLYKGLMLALNGIDADRTSAVVLVTDGVANLGETRQRQFIKLLQKKDIRLFTFIMGNSANQPLLQAMTKASNGFAMSVSNSEDIVGKLLQATEKVTHQALHGVDLKISGIKTADITPADFGSLYRGQQLVVFGHYWGDGPAKVVLSGQVSGQKINYQTHIDFPSTTHLNPALQRLWAFAAIEDLMQEMQDFGDKPDLKQAVTDIALEYGLVTDYTSMLVVREEVFHARNIKRNNLKRLEKEHQAQQQRAQRAASSNRADTNQPMFNTNRPSLGGGALDPWVLLLLVGSVLLIRMKRFL